MSKGNLRSREQILKEWIDTLRSDKYTQGRTCLKQKSKDIDKYCCLGVLCDIYDSSKYDSFLNTCGSYNYRLDGHSYDIGVPSSIQKFLGLNKYSDKWLCSFHSYLVDLNDVHKYTFEQIADEIEKNLPQLLED